MIITHKSLEKDYQKCIKSFKSNLNIIKNPVLLRLFNGTLFKALWSSIPCIFYCWNWFFIRKKNPNFDTSFITSYAGNFGTPALVIFSLTSTGVTFDIFAEYFIYALILLSSFALIGLVF